MCSALLASTPSRVQEARDIAPRKHDGRIWPACVTGQLAQAVLRSPEVRLAPESPQSYAVQDQLGESRREPPHVTHWHHDRQVFPAVDQDEERTPVNDGLSHVLVAECRPICRACLWPDVGNWRRTPLRHSWRCDMRSPGAASAPAVATRAGASGPGRQRLGTLGDRGILCGHRGSASHASSSSGVESTNSRSLRFGCFCSAWYSLGSPLS